MPTLPRLVNSTRRLYQRLFQRSSDGQLQQVAAVLKKATAFQELARSELLELAEAVHMRTYQRDEFLYYEDDPGLGLYIIQRGRVRLLVEDETGAVHELRQADEFEMIGDLSILGDFRRMTTAQAVTETHVLGFFRPDLKTMRKRNPRAGANVLAALARHMAARQVESIRLGSQREGKVAALRLYESAALRANGHRSGLPVLPEE